VNNAPWAARLLADRADATYAIADRRKQSVALFAEVAAKHPKDPAAPQALYMACLAALELGEFAVALGHSVRFRTAYPDHALAPDALHVAAESQVQLGKLSEADAIYRALLQKYPSHSGAESWKVRRAAVLHAQKKHEETIRAIEPLLPDLRAPECVAEAKYLVGVSQLELKRPGEAVKSLAASLEAQPAWRQGFETCLALAEAHRQTGDLAGAQAAARRAIESFPESPLLDRAYFRLGTYLSLAGQAGAAAEAYRKVVAQWPESPLAPLALHELGCAQLNAKDAAGAEATFNKLLEKPPPPALARKAKYARAMARQQQGKPAEAAADLDAVLAAWPDAKEKSDARFLLGICQIELKQYGKAAATLRALLVEDPKYDAREESLHQWAWALKRAGRETESLEVFAKLAAEYPKSPLAPEAQFNVAESRFRGKDYAAAADAYYATMQNAPGTPFAEKAAYQLALCYYRQGNFADAGKTFAYYHGKYPDQPLAAEAAFMEAECLFQQGKAAEALAAYAQLKPSSNPQTQAAILLHAGQAAGKLARWAESVEWLERLVRELPDSPALADALCELGVARQNLGKPSEAVAAFQQAIAKSDREPAARAQFLIGKIQLEQNGIKEALNTFLKVVYGYSYPKWQADAAFEAARCHEALDQKSQAVGMYREILDKFPKSECAAAAKKRLAELENEK
jgi:TolA-binding protein